MHVIINGNDEEVPAGTTVAQLLDRLDLRRTHVAVELNRQIVPREEHGNTPVKEGDELEVVTLVGGG